MIKTQQVLNDAIHSQVKKFTSKQQRWYYERGEFSEIENRSLKETIGLIRNFPWEEHRDETMIGLNGPSVTIENGAGAFLKIGQYYNGRYMLYYLNDKDKIFCRIGERLIELERDVTDFFEKGIDDSAINVYRAGIRSKRKYFETGTFEYEVSPGSMLRMMYVPLIIVSTILFPAIFATLTGPTESLTGMLLVFSLMSLFFVLPHCRFLWNYYFFCRKLLIKVSRGADTFYFGEKGKVKAYSKSEIRTIRTFNNQRHRSPWAEFYAFEIEMRDGTVLKFTNLMMTSWMLGEKFPQVIISDKHKAYPFVSETN